MFIGILGSPLHLVFAAIGFILTASLIFVFDVLIKYYKSRPPRESHPVRDALDPDRAERAMLRAGKSLARWLGRTTLRPSPLGMIADVVLLVAAGAVLFYHLTEIDYWAYPVEPTPEPAALDSVTVYDRDQAETLYTPNMFEVTDLDGRCCDWDDVDPVTPGEAAGGGYKVLMFRTPQILLPPEGQRPSSFMTCNGAWTGQYTNDVFAGKLMHSLKRIDTDFQLDVWQVQIHGMRAGEPYLSPYMRHACQQMGGCMDKHIVLAKAGPAQWQMAKDHERMWQSTTVPDGGGTPIQFWNASHDAVEFDSTHKPDRVEPKAVVVDPAGRIRAVVDGYSPLIDVLAALRAVVEADGNDFPDKPLVRADQKGVDPDVVGYELWLDRAYERMRQDGAIGHDSTSRRPPKRRSDQGTSAAAGEADNSGDVEPLYYRGGPPPQLSMAKWIMANFPRETLTIPKHLRVGLNPGQPPQQQARAPSQEGR